MKVPFYTSTREYEAHKEKFDSAVQNVMARGDFILGSEVKSFEQEVASYAKSKYTIGVANGSDALVIASDVLGYKDNAEVLTPTFTFCIHILYCTSWWKACFTDVDPDTFCMDMNDAAHRITKTRLASCLFTFFTNGRYELLHETCKRQFLSVLEDAAEAFGMKQLYNGEWKTAGTIGDFGVYSFSH